MYRKVLIVLDGSERGIVPLVAPLAGALGAEVRAVRVLDPYQIDEALLAGTDIFQASHDLLRSALAPLAESGFKTQFEVLEGTNAADRVVADATEWGAGLIALATDEASAGGNLAEQITRRAPCPVLLANARARHASRETLPV